MYDMGQNYPESITARASVDELRKWEREASEEAEPRDWVQAREVQVVERVVAEQQPTRPLSAAAAARVLESTGFSVPNAATQAVHRSFNPGM